MAGPILITGSEGLIGSALRVALERRGDRVIGLDLRATGAEQGDVREVLRVRDAIAECAGVVHLAAVSRVIEGERDPDRCLSTNLIGVRNVLQAAEWVPTPAWVVFASSREVYGEPRQLPVAEDAPLAPVNVYGRTKVAGEEMVAEARAQGLRTATLRLSNVYGSTHDHGDRVVPAFVRGALAGDALRVDGADHTFDFTYLDDTIAGIVRAIDRIDQQLPPLHLLTGQPTTLGQLAALAIELAGGGTIIDGPPRTFDVAKFVGDPARARDVLGWSATTSIRDGLARMLASYRAAR
jgi:UDP-glucose 4-epimerase